MQQGTGLLKRCIRPNGDDLIRSGHHGTHGSVIVRGQQDIALGNQADQFIAAIGHHQSPNIVQFHQGPGLGDGGFLVDGVRVLNHKSFSPLHPGHLLGLSLNGHKTMDDADPTGPSHSNGHGGLGDRIHIGADNGNLQADGRGQPG